MKAYRLEILIIDFEELGANNIIEEMQNANFANDCINPQVMKIQEADIGLWSDEHLLNHSDTNKVEFNRLFDENK